MSSQGGDRQLHAPEPGLTKYCRLDLFEARAILLGRLGRHDQALELYAYRLQDYLKAEEYVGS
jgi:hypothetical protein